MTQISDLPWDLVEQILSRVLVTKAVRLTCKRWNTLFKDESFIKTNSGKAAKEYLLTRTPDKRSTRFILYGTDNIKDLSSVKEIRRMVSPFAIYKVYPCDGLFLCLPSGNCDLLVWNPYLSQTRLIEGSNALDGGNLYALGYDDNNNNYKVLRFFNRNREIVEPELYDFKYDAWRVLDISIECHIWSSSRTGVSLKGNTYFVGRELWGVGFVICFDFTTEEFGPRLHLPCEADDRDNVVSSCVREEQLAVLHQECRNTYELEIWITTNIEPSAVSWSKLFIFDMKLVGGVDIFSNFRVKSFYLDKEKKLAVVSCGYGSYVVGEDGYYKEFGYEWDVFSYVPSSVFIQDEDGENEEEEEDEDSEGEGDLLYLSFKKEE